MVLPTFEDIMLPLLKFLSDEKEKNYSEITSYLSKHFNLNSEDLELEKPSGGNLFYNRIGWAKRYLTQAVILNNQSGKFKISNRGLDVLKKNPSKIDRKFLRKFKEFNDRPISSSKKDQLSNDDVKFPDELIEEGVSQINIVLRDDLLKKVKTIEPIFFEHLIIDLMEKLGYGKGIHVGKPGDGGIDGEIPQDALGLETIFLQAKRYSSNVSAKQVREFSGALSGKKSSKGVFITTSDFTQGSRDHVADSLTKIILINGKELIEYMIKNNVGVKTKKSIQTKEIDEEYFDFDSK